MAFASRERYGIEDGKLETTASPSHIRGKQAVVVCVRTHARICSGDMAASLNDGLAILSVDIKKPLRNRYTSRSRAIPSHPI